MTNPSVLSPGQTRKRVQTESARESRRARKNWRPNEGESLNLPNLFGSGRTRVAQGAREFPVKWGPGLLAILVLVWPTAHGPVQSVSAIILIRMSCSMLRLRRAVEKCQSVLTRYPNNEKHAVEINRPTASCRQSLLVLDALIKSSFSCLIYYVLHLNYFMSKTWLHLLIYAFFYSTQDTKTFQRPESSRGR